MDHLHFKLIKDHILPSVTEMGYDVIPISTFVSGIIPIKQPQRNGMQCTKASWILENIGSDQFHMLLKAQKERSAL